MKRVAMLVAALTVAGSSPTVVSIPDGYLGTFVTTLICADFTTVDCGTPTVTAPMTTPPAVSTGPFTMRVSTAPDSDCYAADGVYPNGSLVNERWAKCL